MVCCSSSDSSASKSNSSCLATASVTYWLKFPRPQPAAGQLMSGPLASKYLPCALLEGLPLARDGLSTSSSPCSARPGRSSWSRSARSTAARGWFRSPEAVVERTALREHSWRRLPIAATQEAWPLSLVSVPLAHQPAAAISGSPLGVRPVLPSGLTDRPWSLCYQR